MSSTGQGFEPIEVFGPEVVYDVYDSPTTATHNVVYKPDAGCIGELIVTNCSLRAGTVQYSILINGPASTVPLNPETSIWDDKPIGDPDSLNHEGYTQGTTTYGGIFLSLANQFITNWFFKFAGAIGYEFVGTQSEASISYACNVTSKPSCDLTFIDPLPDFLQSTREPIFRTAVSTANSSDVQII